MALVESYISERGNIINIYDDYVVKTKEEVDEIWCRVERIASDALAYKILVDMAIRCYVAEKRDQV